MARGAGPRQKSVSTATADARPARRIRPPKQAAAHRKAQRAVRLTGHPGSAGGEKIEPSGAAAIL